MTPADILTISAALFGFAAGLLLSRLRGRSDYYDGFGDGYKVGYSRAMKASVGQVDTVSRMAKEAARRARVAPLAASNR